MNSISQVLDTNAAVLLEKGAHTKTLCSLVKLVGLVGLVAGTLSIGTNNVSVGATTATLGGALYVGAISKELDTTGLLMPVPFFSADIGMIARSAGISGEQAQRLTEVDYLTQEERAKLAMATTLKPLTIALDNLPEAEQVPSYHMLKNALVSGYPDAIKAVTHLPALLPDYGGLDGIQANLAQSLPPAHREVFVSAEVPGIAPTKQKRVAPKDDSWKGSISVPSVSVAEPKSASVQTNTPPRPKRTDRPAATLSITALSSLEKSPFISRAWFGGQRTGKSYLAAVASKRLHEKNGTRVFHINLASYGGEDEYYWSHVDSWDSVCCDISAMDMATAQAKISEAVNLIHEFYATTNALLVFDELAYAGSKTNRHGDALEMLMHTLADKIATLASTGIKRQKALWTLAPEFVASALIKDALAVKKLGLVLCAIAPGHKACWKDSSGQPHSLTFDWALHKMVSNNFECAAPPTHSQHSRIAFIDNQWVSPGVDGTELKA